MSNRFRTPIALLVIIGLILAFYNKLAFSNLILARGDTFHYFYPYWEAAATALKAGRVPLWNPDLFMGAPLMANSQIGFFYPLNWPLWYFLRVPYAASATIILHSIIAGLGVYFVARKVLNLGQLAAVFGAILFPLGGYFSAQVEHLNQVQGLAWLPWFIVVLGRPCPQPINILRRTLAIGALFGLQILAGHTQSAFITGIGVGVWLTLTVIGTIRENGLGYGIGRFLPMALGALFAVAISAIQILPTLELTNMSSRSGGMDINNALSFSLHPFLTSKALLPNYGQGLFTEYMASLPITALLLAFVGAGQAKRKRGVWPLIVLAILGLLLGLGNAVPLNFQIYKLPGFALFRVPARWLILYGLGVSLLAAVGIDALKEKVAARKGSSWSLGLGVLFIAGLFGIGYAATRIGGIPFPPEAPPEAPNQLTFWGRIAELAIASVAIGIWLRSKSAVKWIAPTLAILSCVVLFFATRLHPYNDPTTPEAYFDLRPAMARMLVHKSEVICRGNGRLTYFTNDLPLGSSPCDLNDRMLSMSDIFFDVGDQPEIDTIYLDQLSDKARYDYTIAIKEKEIVAPNLPMSYGLTSMDGFDGGILPLQGFTKLTRLILPEGVETTDGRLREHLQAVPDAKWLDLFNNRYILTDKLTSIWIDGVFFDLQLPAEIEAGQSQSVGSVTPFDSNEVRFIAHSEPKKVSISVDHEPEVLIPELIDPDKNLYRITYQTEKNHSLAIGGTEPGEFEFIGYASQQNGYRDFVAETKPTKITVTYNSELELLPELINSDHNLYRAEFPRGTPKHIEIFAGDEPMRVDGLTLTNTENLIDTGGPAYMPQIFGQYRRIYSGDVSVYENLDVLPRAFMVHDWQWADNSEVALAGMDFADFDVRERAILTGFPRPEVVDPSAHGTADILSYAPEKIVIKTNSDTDGLLVVSDARFPGWVAYVDDRPALLYEADVMFRGVFVPAGEHDVVLNYESQSYGRGRQVTLLAVGIWLLLAGLSFVWGRRRKNSMG